MVDFSIEEDERAKAGRKLTIAGVDEVGRGPWAGPVIAAAVVPLEGFDVDGIRDSKKLTAARREELSGRIRQQSHVSLGTATVEEIDTLNILQATFLAMRRAVENLPVHIDLALVDGNKSPELDCRTRTVVKGDSVSASIAAASIVAKVDRDRLMANLAQEFAGYGWETNKGYGTRQHIEGLARLGVTPHHRRSFAPIHKILSEDSSLTL